MKLHFLSSNQWETWEFHWDELQEVATNNIVPLYNFESYSSPIWGCSYVKGAWN